MKKTGPRTECCGILQVRGDEGQLCGGIPTVDVWDERYEVNHCSETEEMPNQLERRWIRMEWLRISKAADRSRRQAGDLLHGDALERWSCSESSVVSVE